MFNRRTSSRTGTRVASISRNRLQPATAGARPVEPLEGRTLFSAGDLDPSFGLGGIASLNVPGTESESVTAVDYANGRIVVGGVVPAQSGTANTKSSVALGVFDSKGKPVTSFSGDGLQTALLGVEGGVIDLAVQSDNKIVVLAGLTNGTSNQRVLARFNADGSLDKTFGGAGTGQRLLDAGQAISLAPGGKVVVATGDAAGRVSVSRFSTAGTPDGVGRITSVQLGTGIPGVTDVVVQSDGKVVVSGTTYNGTYGFTDGFVVRLQPSSAGVDASFGGGDGIVLFDSNFSYDNYDRVSALALDGQGRIVAGVYLGAGSSSVRRLTAAGAIDGTFATTTFTEGGDIDSLNVAPDGKIVASGYNWYSGDLLARFNANGGADTSFGRGDGFVVSSDYGNETTGGTLSDVQSDGRIITAGADGFGAARSLAENTTPVGTATLGSDGVVRVTGTEAGNDDVRITDPGAEFSSNGVVVYINGRTSNFPWQQVKRIEVSTLGGNDRVIDVSMLGNQNMIPRTINGGAGNDDLHGGRGNDTLLGLDGNDKLYGDAGNDLLDGGAGTDLIDGGLGADTVDYSFRNSAVFVDLQGDADDGPAGEHDTVMPSIEHIIGGRGNDTLVGDDRPNFIQGGGGNDTIRGGGGNDTLVGGAGQDKLYGDAGDDFLDAKDGITDLVLDGGSGTDTARKDNNDPRTSIELLA